ncbi:MAG: class I SAM-dependent methyltransferase [Spirosomataceae bacterium]
MDMNLIYDDAAPAFDRQSAIFDELYGKNAIIEYKRHRTRSHLEKYLLPGSELLELNAGTGQDAVYFAQKGHRVVATDISAGMLAQLNRKVTELNLSDSVCSEQVSFTELSTLKHQGPFDAIFSNFGGLNCTYQLDKITASFAGLLKPNGTVTLVIMPPFCLWELLTLLKGNTRLAFRRFGAGKGAKAHIEGVNFLCWYYKPAHIIEFLKKEFDLVSLEGLCTLVPPSYLETFPNKYPRLYSLLQKWEDRWKGTFPFNCIGDYFIITLRKREIGNAA